MRILSLCHRSSLTRLAFLSLVLLLAGLFPARGLAATIVVNETTDENNFDGDCSLREAVRAANFDAFIDGCNAGSGADTILIPAGTYVLSLVGAGEDDAATGDLDLNGEITITTTSKARPVIIENTGERAFQIHTPGVGGVVQFIHVEINDSGNSSLNGGAIDIQPPLDVEVIVDDCVFTNNIAAFGGAILNFDGRLTVKNSTFVGNHSRIGGGALQTGGFNSSLLIEDTLFEGNSDEAIIYPFLGGFGGGGAVYLERTATIRRSAFVGNHSEGGGGGIAIPTSNTVLIEDSTFSGNTALTGGGIHCGDFFDATCSSTTIRSSTITLNQAETGGGLHDELGVPHFTIENTIVAGNLATISSPDIHGDVWTEGHNLIGNNESAFLVPPVPSDPDTDLIGTPATPIDPLLGPLAFNGYDLPFHRPLPGSPALDSGVLTGPPFDQRNEPRGVDGFPDRGAIEQKYFDTAYYVDLGTGSSFVASSFGAAADLPGDWNEVSIGTKALVDTSGVSNGVNLEVLTTFDHTPLISMGTTPL